MEAILGISLYSYLISTSKNLCLSYYCYVYSSTKLEEKANRFCLEAKELGGGEGGGGGRGRNAQTTYVHMNI
jgi:hypothetical protein